MQSLAKAAAIIFLAIGLVACSATQVAKTSSKANMLAKIDAVSASSYAEECTEAIEYYSLDKTNFVMPARFFRHQNCLGIENLAVIVYPGTETPKTEAAARLLSLMWAEWHAAKNPGIKVTIVELKADRLSMKGETLNMMFFEVTRKSSE